MSAPSASKPVVPAAATKTPIGAADTPKHPGGAADVEGAVDFLQRLRPGGPWVLTAIVPDGTTTTITTRDAGQVRDFIQEHDGRKNIYYSVNSTTRSLSSKAAKKDIAAAEFLFADIDPRDDEAPADAKARYLERLATFEPRPSFVVDSGNGLQVIWRLDVARGPDAFAEVETRTKATILALGGPAGTQNVDRILRLPGTTNLPNAKKRKDGRVPCATRLLSYSDIAHPLAAFPEAPQRDSTAGAVRPKSNGHNAGAPITVDFDALPRVNIDALPVTDRIRHMIRTGEDVDEPTVPYADRRSERVFAVLVALAAAGCDDPTMAAVMLDPALRIGQHVRDQRESRKYLERQIGRARDRASDPAVAELNERYALVIAGDRAAVLEERAEGFRLLPVSTFKTYLENRTVRVGGRRVVKLAQHWLQHRRRRDFDDIVFAPGRDVPGAYNLWRGWAAEPRPGDCSKFLAHLRDNICCRKEDLYRWVVGWFADIVQHPAAKCGTSLAVRGKMGVGKTKVGEVFGSILGRHYTLVADPRYITGRFNSHLVGCLLLHADEAFWAGDRAAEGKLKDLITGHEHLIEFKGKEPFRVRNQVRLFVTGNPDWVVPAGMEERRFAVLDAGEDHMQENPYFAAIDAEMDSGGREALLHHLLTFDLTAVDPRTIPRTNALIEQKIASMTPEQAWWLDTLSRGELPLGCDRTGDCPTGELIDRYIEHARRRGIPRRASETTLGIFLNKFVPGGLHKNRDGWYKVRGGSVISGTVYEFPPLRDCRSAFTERMQMAEHQWDGPLEWRSEPTPEPEEGPI